MHQPIDLAGRRFGFWLVLERADRRKFWRCRCDCGTLREVAGGNLRDGLTRSCGCEKDRKSSERFRKHGDTGSRLYRAWQNMLSRCRNIRLSEYPRYGGREIKVCDEWNDFAVFRSWALRNGYSDNLTLDRIDSDKRYFPENCRWATRAVQAINRGCVRTLPDGRKAVEVARTHGIGPGTYSSRLRYGWEPLKAATTPPRSLRKRG